MRVLYFHQHFITPSQGGGTRSYEFAQYLIKKGHSVTIICGGEISTLNLSRSKNKGINCGNIDGIDVIQIETPYSNSDGIFRRMNVFVKYALKGIKYALKEDYDILFATSTPLTVGIPGIVMKFFRKKIFVFEVRDLWPDLPRALGIKNPFLLHGMRILEKMCYRYADACIGLSPGICEGIKKSSPKNKIIEMIPNGCDLEIFKPAKREDLVLSGIKATDIIAVFTGAHGVANGLTAILDAASELKRLNRTDIKLVFIGEGKMKVSLVERAKKELLDNCLFYDSMPKIQLNKIIASADIGMMVLANIPAFYYGTSPNKFFDYISCGLPVLNNYPGWLADMIQKYQCGIVVEPENVEAFAQGLIYLADHPEQRMKYRNNARALAENKFSRQELAGRFVSFLEEIQITKSKNV